MSNLIKLENINKSYKLKGEEIPILKDINLSVEKGEFLMIMGKSGSGKTTLMNLLAFLDNYQSGTYYFLNENTTKFKEKSKCKLRNENMGFVFQQFHLVDSLNVYQNVELPLLYSKKYNKKERSAMVEKSLNLVDLSDRKSHKPSELSGGQQQRVAIARALINDPAIIFADEPTGALDSENSKLVMDLFKKLSNLGKTIVMVTHDEDLVTYSTRVIHIKDGEIKEVDK